MLTTVFYHAHCLDGFGAAYAAWRHFGDQASYRPMHYDQPWEHEDVIGRDVFILDFSFAPATLRTMASMAHRVHLIDHHVSAQQPWAAVLKFREDGMACYRDPDLPLDLDFNLNKSGARLAWEHFQAGVPCPLALQHIEDQDLWRFQLPGTRAFCRALRLSAFDFPTWERIIQDAHAPDSPRYRSMLAQGEAIENFCALEVQRLAESQLVMPAILQNVTGLAINASALFSSDLGHQLAQRSGTFGLIWQLGQDGMVQVSLRANGKTNVAELAQQQGGGGHPNAAGFQMPAVRFFAEVLAASPSTPTSSIV